ncbi:MAG: bifunctional folylpolyglutamate synthase/dihydrofolate synthase [Shimia sp.]
MMTLHPKVIDLTLDRVWRLLHALGNPQNDLPPVVHIAGTNGKGSTLAMIRAGLEGAGHKVHAYTSPHLARFHERIRLAGELISEEALTAILDECMAANGDAPITYFEITTVAGILAMARTPADYCLLEVGLGGRLDATNVVETPALTVITPVDLDHQQFLGETLAEIAGEKAGILKRGVPCVVGPQKPEGMDVIEARAARLGVPLLAHGQHWHVATERGRLVVQDETGLADLPMPSLRGPHQVLNAGAAVVALRALGMDATALEAAMSNATWPARMQRLTEHPLQKRMPGAEIWLDGGHNPAAGEAIAATLADLPARRTFAICGMLDTKDVRGFLRPLAPHLEGLRAVSIPGEARTLSAAQTADAARDEGIAVSEADGVGEAMADLPADARILLCGSLYLAGSILRMVD